MTGIKIDLTKTVGTASDGRKTGSEKGGTMKSVVTGKQTIAK